MEIVTRLWNSMVAACGELILSAGQVTRWCGTITFHRVRNGPRPSSWDWNDKSLEVSIIARVRSAELHTPWRDLNLLTRVGQF